MSDTPEITSKNFEAMTQELERILSVLEDGTTSLEDSLAQYERGVHLVRSCHEFLSKSEQRIRLFTGIGEDGKLRHDTFDHTATYPDNR